ncbi:pilus assembly protein TadG-related protein [Tundrisphaera lichenicola]|uniref:pilus assembly protein TadG-related protein n=1 Tax=Tundrisphaera lichenicola TaxID=2029860 RepID=UPI003EB7AC76
MTSQRKSSQRRGSVMPVVALLMVALCGFTAISVEISTIASLKVQCQNAADAAALAGARTLDGSDSPKTSQARSNALAAAAANTALGLNDAGAMALVAFRSSEVGVTCGTYHYDSQSQRFYPAYTLGDAETYNLVQVSAQRAVRNAFFSVGGGGSPAVNQTVVARAVAAHRPRDIAIVLDFSGSMNNESDLWNCESYLGSYNGKSNNSDPVVPAFGHYSSSGASLVSTSTAPGGQCNLTQSIQGTPALVDGFFQNARTVTTGAAAFVAQPNSYATQPKGDVPVYVNNTGSGSFAQTINQMLGTSNTTTISQNSTADYFENGSTPSGSQGSSDSPSAGYDRLYAQTTPASPSGRNTVGLPGFSGYTVGPKYWGKTFFQWPPDPRPSRDWRQLYFTTSSGSPVTDNTALWDSSSKAWQPPYESGVTNYKVNYKAILSWIKTTGPNPFPPILRAGRILYYDQIPDDVPASAYNHNQLNSNITDPNQRFWKEYIDYSLGIWRDPYGNVQAAGSPSCSMGPDYNWGTIQVSARPTGSAGNNKRLAYMNYNDNPPRPRHRMWFGPMTLIQFISDTGINPGTERDISTYSAKLGIASVLQDIQVNHPNDSVAILIYNRPQYNGEPSVGRFNLPLFNLNRDYSAMIDAMWYPPNSGTDDVRPWDEDGNLAPRADFDFTSNTATQHGLMLAYNQMSGSSTVSNLGAGGLGRKGAKRLVILETDGMANVNTNAGFTNNGAINSYYRILPGQSFTAAGYNQNSLLQVAQAICNNGNGVAGTPNSEVANPGYPGFATSNKPVLIHTIAFGVVFEIASSSQTSAVDLLQSISAIGGTTFPSSPSDPDNGYKWCTGSLSTRLQKLQQAFANVLDDGNSVSLIQ